MPNRSLPRLLQSLATAACLVCGGAALAADRPPPGGYADRPLVLQDRSRGGQVMYEAWAPRQPVHGRPINGGPGYVGSDYGLGKPAFTGLGTRPDWGRSD